MTPPTMADAAGRPVRVQRSRAKGWKMPPNTVYVGRPSKWGNPFPIDIYGAADAVDRFRRLLSGNMSTHEMSESSRCDRWSNPEQHVSLVTLRRWIVGEFQDLRGKNLACWCALVDKDGKPVPCHADVLLDLANKEPPR